MIARIETERDVAVREAVRVLRPGGRLLALTLNKHAHKAAAEEFDHCNLGFTVDELKKRNL